MPRAPRPLPTPTPLRLTDSRDLSADLAKLHVTSLCVGPAGEPLIVASDDDAAFVVEIRDAGAVRTRLSCRKQDIDFAQPLPDGELLGVGAHSVRRRNGEADRNAHVFGRDGARIRSFVLGDGIAHVQTTSDGRIWVAYFDEGVFGNRGWNVPIGAPGLVCFDLEGNASYRHSDERMADCYALNVASDRDTWLYYYTEFPLVRVRDLREHARFVCPVRGARAFAVAGHRVLFAGAYDDASSLALFELRSPDEMMCVARYELRDDSGEPLIEPLFEGRAGRLHVLWHGRHASLDADALD